MKHSSFHKVKIFLSRRDGEWEKNAYYRINEVCQNYRRVVLEDYQNNPSPGFPQKTLEECALKDDIIVFLITKGAPSERQNIDDKRLKKFLRKGGKVWVFYKLSEQKSKDYQKGKKGPDSWYYDRTDPNLHPNDDYVIYDVCYGKDEKGNDSSLDTLYTLFDRLLSKYKPRTRKWLWAVGVILAIYLMIMLWRPDINKYFHPKAPVQDTSVVAVVDTIKIDSTKDSGIDRNVPQKDTTKKLPESPALNEHSRLSSDTLEVYRSYEGTDNNGKSLPDVSPKVTQDSTPLQLKEVEIKPLIVGELYNEHRIAILNPDGKSGYVYSIDNAGPISYPEPDELAVYVPGWGLPTIRQMKKIFENHILLGLAGVYWTSDIGTKKNMRKAVDFSKESFTVLELKTSNEKEASMLLIKDFVKDE